ncbi:hypothetical protein GCM10008915_64320 [Bifidobacterium pullorum subsp. gallinarum]
MRNITPSLENMKRFPGGESLIQPGNLYFKCIYRNEFEKDVTIEKRGLQITGGSPESPYCIPWKDR